MASMASASGGDPVAGLLGEIIVGPRREAPPPGAALAGGGKAAKAAAPVADAGADAGAGAVAPPGARPGGAGALPRAESLGFLAGVDAVAVPSGAARRGAPSAARSVSTPGGVTDALRGCPPK